MAEEKYVAYVSTYTRGDGHGIRVYDVDMEKGRFVEKDKVEIILDFKPHSIRFLNCTGACKNDKVVIDYIAPYKVAAFEAEY